LGGRGRARWTRGRLVLGGPLRFRLGIRPGLAPLTVPSSLCRFRPFNAWPTLSSRPVDRSVGRSFMLCGPSVGRPFYAWPTLSTEPPSPVLPSSAPPYHLFSHPAFCRPSQPNPLPPSIFHVSAPLMRSVDARGDRPKDGRRREASTPCSYARAHASRCARARVKRCAAGTGGLRPLRLRPLLPHGALPPSAPCLLFSPRRNAASRG
jgi:hypothetical protein